MPFLDFKLRMFQQQVSIRIIERFMYEQVPKELLHEEQNDIDYSRSSTYKWGFERERVSNEWEWHVEELENDKGVYIDLLANPEGFTGYQGQKIWEVIHRENCFTGSYNSLCREEKALNKIISGLHTSISIIYVKNIRQFPDRIRNLFFLYAFLLRSYTLAQNAINQVKIRSNDTFSDAYAAQQLQQLQEVTESECQQVFDEKTFYRQLDSNILKRYQQFISNISQIMNCVECEKCKLHAKVQTYGIGAGMKIIFSNFPNSFNGRIKRNELIAFLNTFAKLSNGVKIVQSQLERADQLAIKYILSITIVGGIGFILLVVMILRSRRRERKNKLEKEKHE